jgi:hypothetical protein
MTSGRFDGFTFLKQAGGSGKGENLRFGIKNIGTFFPAAVRGRMSCRAAAYSGYKKGLSA